MSQTILFSNLSSLLFLLSSCIFHLIFSHPFLVSSSASFFFRSSFAFSHVQTSPLLNPIILSSNFPVIITIIIFSLPFTNFFLFLPLNLSPSLTSSQSLSWAESSSNLIEQVKRRRERMRGKNRCLFSFRSSFFVSLSSHFLLSFSPLSYSILVLLFSSLLFQAFFNW